MFVGLADEVQVKKSFRHRGDFARSHGIGFPSADFPVDRR